MQAINHVTILGQIGRDPKGGISKNGKSWVNLAINVQKKASASSYMTMWFNVAAFGDVADLLISAHKGDFVLISGELSQNVYQDKETGKKVTGVQVIAKTAMKLVPEDAGPPEPEEQSFDQSGEPF